MDMIQKLRCTGGLHYFRIPNTFIKQGLLEKGAVYELTVKRTDVIKEPTFIVNKQGVPKYQIQQRGGKHDR